MISSELLDTVRPLVDRFHAAGRQLFLVGGIVRDELLSAKSRSWSDIDLATDARPEETKRIVAPLADAVWNQGERFGTIGCRIAGEAIEITTFRGEAYEASSRKPLVVFENALERDLARRDFTINAMAADASTGELHDPFDGRADLVARRLRTPLGADSSFGDDPLRMLRAARFLARFALDADADILEAIERQRGRLVIVSAERVRDELQKLLVVDDPTRGLRFLFDHRLLDRWLPELSELNAVSDDRDLAHTLAVVAGCPPTALVRIAALLHDVVPDDTDVVPDVTAGAHEALSAACAAVRLRDLHFATDDLRSIHTLIALHHRLDHPVDDWAAPAVRRVLLDAGDLIEPLVLLSRANASARDETAARRAVGSIEAFLRARDALGETAADLVPELDGNDVMAILGLAPGPQVGIARAFLCDLRIEHGPLGRERAADALRIWWSESPHTTERDRSV